MSTRNLRTLGTPHSQDGGSAANTSSFFVSSQVFIWFSCQLSALEMASDFAPTLPPGGKLKRPFLQLLVINGQIAQPPAGQFHVHAAFSPRIRFPLPLLRH